MTNKPHTPAPAPASIEEAGAALRHTLDRRALLLLGGASAVALAGLGAAPAEAARLESPDPFGPIFVDSMRVQASGTRGATAYREVTLNAGPRRAFLPDSIRFVEASRSGGGHIAARFMTERYKLRDVPVTVAGRVLRIQLPYEITISLHAETGSGPGNYNRGAWLNGHVHALTIETHR